MYNTPTPKIPTSVLVTVTKYQVTKRKLTLTPHIWRFILQLFLHFGVAGVAQIPLPLNNTKLSVGRKHMARRRGSIKKANFISSTKLWDDESSVWHRDTDANWRGGELLPQPPYLSNILRSTQLQFHCIQQMLTHFHQKLLKIQRVINSFYHITWYLKISSTGIGISTMMWKERSCRVAIFLRVWEPQIPLFFVRD